MTEAEQKQGFRAGRPPLALIMKGGGVKGLALVGALLELEKHYAFNTFVGTSAGAIAAVLLASGVKAEELESRLRAQNFLDFLDSSHLSRLRNLYLFGGLHSGNAFEQWIEVILNEKIERQQKVEMRDLPYRAIIYASNEDKGTVTFDSRGENNNTPASFAVRCSMSIPYFFVPREHHGTPIFDGGLLNNFPVSIFREQHPNVDFLGIYLSSGTKTRTSSSMAGMLVNIITGRDERTLVDKHKDKMIVIDPSPVRTTQFSLDSVEKDFLVCQGRASALKFLSVKRPELMLNDAYHVCRKEAGQLRDKVFELRLRRSRRRVLIVLSISVIVIGAFLGSWSLTGSVPEHTEAVPVTPTVSSDTTTGAAALAANSIEVLADSKQVQFSIERFPYAAAVGQIEIVKDLLGRGASVNQKTSDGDTALHFAAREGHLSVVNLLLEHKADINALNENKQSPLYLAAKAGRTEVVSVLIERGGKLEQAAHVGTGMFASQYESPLAAAAADGHGEVVALLTANGASVNPAATVNQSMGTTSYASPLEKAIENRHFSIVEFLLRHGARADDYDLLHAVEGTAPKAIVVGLIKAGAKFSATDYSENTALAIARKSKNSELEKTLVEYGAK